jgi:hypothetical protein
MEKSDLEVELIMSLLIFYADRVFKGLDTKKTAELGWYLPRKKQSYVNRSSLLQDPNLINKQPKTFRTILPLKEYFRVNIAEKGWDPIVLPKIKSLQPRDTDVILQIKNVCLSQENNRL